MRRAGALLDDQNRVVARRAQLVDGAHRAAPPYESRSQDLWHVQPRQGAAEAGAHMRVALVTALVPSPLL